jgi:S1-C subfamily serine protease
VANGKVIHPFLGIRYLPLNPAIAAQIGVQATEGNIIGEVVPDSPADKAGLQPRDVVVAVDKTPLKSESDLARIINEHKPGDQLTLSVLRGSKKMDVQLTLGEMPSSA